MKFVGHIEGVQLDGGHLEIEMKLAAETEPEGTWLRACRITMPDTARSREAYHVGRDVTLTLEVKP